MRKNVISLILTGSLLLSGCSLVTLETNPKPTAAEETQITEETTTVKETEASVTETTTAIVETTVTEETKTSETEPVETVPEVTSVPVTPKTTGKVVILATGGTIAGVGDAGKSARLLLKTLSVLFRSLLKLHRSKQFRFAT